jgi:hypothetical protein
VTEDAGANGGGAEALQFDRAEFVGGQGGRVCGPCKRTIDDQYFEARGNVLCPKCADELRGTGQGVWWRALGYGSGAALLATIVWGIMLKMDAGYGLIAIGVGLLVGFAVRKGARGRGGWRYQALAMALTYLAMTVVYAPMVVKAMIDGSKAARAQHRAAPGDVAGEGTSASEAKSDPPPPKISRAGMASAMALFLAIVLALALAAPFFGGASSIMNLLIIGIALYEAWKINRQVVVTGPFTAGPASGGPSAPAAPAT